MFTLLLMLALQVTAPGEMSCLDSVIDLSMPADLYIAGIEQEGLGTMATTGQLVYLNGPRVLHLKIGEIGRVVRPEGKVHDPLTGIELGVYYRDLGTVRIEVLNRNVATARVLSGCHGMLKGDLVTPHISKPAVEFRGEFSSALTPFPYDNPTGSIVLGKNDVQELAKGSICFISCGWRDGVKVGDRFMVFRFHPPFDPREKAVEATVVSTNSSLTRIQDNQSRLASLLSRRTLPRQILGDIVVVDVGDRVSAGKIINSLSAIHPGDFIVKR